MITCEALSDRIPAVARGEAAWTAAEAEHLAGCRECRDELALVRAATVLGAGVARRVDADHVAVRVAERLRQAGTPVVTPAAWGRRLALPLAVAATLALVVWSGGTPPTPAEEAPAAALTAMLDELDGLDAAELERVLADVPVPGEDELRPIDAMESLGDLSDTELEAVLSTLEG